MRFSRRILGVLAVMLSIFVTIPVFAETFEIKKDELSINLGEDYYLITKDNYVTNESYESILDSNGMSELDIPYEYYIEMMKYYFGEDSVVAMITNEKDSIDDIIVRAIYRDSYVQHDKKELEVYCDSYVNSEIRNGNKEVKCSIVEIQNGDNKYNYIRGTFIDAKTNKYVTKYSLICDGVNYIILFSADDEYYFEETKEVVSKVTIHKAKSAAEMDSDFVNRNWLPIVIVVVAALIAFVLIVKQNKKK